mgnify:FL=1
MSNNKKSYTASAAIPAYSLVEFASSDSEVKTALNASSLIIGVTDDIDVSQGNIADVCHCGIAEVRAGGTIAKGEAFTAQNGKAVKAKAGEITAGYVLRDAVEDQIIPAVITRGQVPPAASEEST